jgi:hypothetical protein
VIYRQVGVQVEEEPFVFPAGDNRLTVYETAIRLGKVPFSREGQYEFRVITPIGETHQALDGLVAEVSVLDPARRI